MQKYITYSENNVASMLATVSILMETPAFYLLCFKQ